jgi:hypothetical protein
VAGQHASPEPPQATHVPALHMLNGAVQPTGSGADPTQHALPIEPHVVPPTHAPAVHVPTPPPHMAAAATQVLVLWSQQAPAPVQRLSSQHA